jgi:hypothetical protein
LPFPTLTRQLDSNFRPESFLSRLVKEYHSGIIPRGCQHGYIC